MIGIVDYGMGNLRSVYNALSYLECPASLVARPDDIRRCDRLVVPGVGAYAKAMTNLEPTGLAHAIQEHVAAKKPLLGICLGMQLLSSHGNEPHPCKGLGLIPGDVKLLTPPAGYELPHVGWNTIQIVREHPVFQGIKRHADFYFVHSYHFVPEHAEDTLTTTDYGVDFVSAVGKNNLVGIQFHPEKSQDNGLRILENFSHWDGSC